MGYPDACFFNCWYTWSKEKKFMRKSKNGFTMIELIFVIVILGILAGIAIPRFINQTTNARIASLYGVAGAVASATALAQAEYLAEGNSSSSSATQIIM